jgi:hypothetical protein
MDVEIRTEATQFPEKEYIHGIFLAVLWRYRKTQYDKMYLLCHLQSAKNYSVSVYSVQKHVLCPEDKVIKMCQQ